MKLFTYITLSSLLIVACSGKTEDNQQQEAQLPNVQGSHAIAITSEQAKTIEIQSGHISERNLSKVIQANGYLDVPPQNKAVISPMISGYVKKLNFLVGDNVKKYQTMAELESMDFVDLQQQYLEIKSRVSFLKEEYNRQQLLSQENAISKKKLLSSQVELQTATSKLDGTTSKLKMLGANFEKLNAGNIETKVLLKAPISGSVKRLNTIIGKHVDATDELFEIIDPDHLHLELNVYEKDIHKVQKGQKVHFLLPSLQNQNFEGEVFLVGKDLSEDKRSINVHVHIDEEESNLSVGMYASASIVISDHPSFALPVTAVVVDGEQEFVFKKIPNFSGDNSYEKYPVVTGTEEAGWIELIEHRNISTTDEIVTVGAFYLSNAFTEGEHNH